MRNWIEIDGKSSSCFGLKMDRLPLWTTAAETVENTALPGVPVEMDRHTGQYKDFDLALTGYLTRPPHNHELAVLNDWIQNGRQLVMSTQPHIYGVIRKAGQITPKRIGTRANEFQIPFTFQPFKYTVQNRPITFDTSPAYYRLWSNIYAEPVYRLTIEDGCILAIFGVNGIMLQIAALALDTGVLVIDLQRRKIYKEEANGDLTIVQKYTSGEFWKMVLTPGNNVITWHPGISKVEVTVNERWL